MTTTAEFIAKLRALDPDGSLRIVTTEWEVVGADGDSVEDVNEPEIAWIMTTTHHLRDRAGAPFSYSVVRWVDERYEGEGAERVVKI